MAGRPDYPPSGALMRALLLTLLLFAPVCWAQSGTSISWFSAGPTVCRVEGNTVSCSAPGEGSAELVYRPAPAPQDDDSWISTAPLICPQPGSFAGCRPPPAKMDLAPPQLQGPERTIDSTEPLDRDIPSLAADVQSLKAQVADLTARLSRLEHPRRKHRGKPAVKKAA